MAVGSGRVFLVGDTRRGQAQGLLECADPEPAAAEVWAYVDVTRADAQLVGCVVGVPVIT